MRHIELFENFGDVKGQFEDIWSGLEDRFNIRKLHVSGFKPHNLMIEINLDKSFNYFENIEDFASEVVNLINFSEPPSRDKMD